MHLIIKSKTQQELVNAAAGEQLVNADGRLEFASMDDVRNLRYALITHVDDGYAAASVKAKDTRWRKIRRTNRDFDSLDWMLVLAKTNSVCRSCEVITGCRVDDLCGNCYIDEKGEGRWASALGSVGLEAC